jgi:hypothetical protein
MSGSYDGKQLAFTVKGSDNASECKDYTLTFTRGKDHYFERLMADGVSTMYLDAE